MSDSENSRGDISDPCSDVPLEELTGFEYLNSPVATLMRHPDFSGDAMRTVNGILHMTTAQLEELGKNLRSTNE